MFFPFLRQALTQDSGRRQRKAHGSSNLQRSKGITARRPFRRLLLESLEDRRLLSATVWTDQLNYVPGTMALVSGTGFQPGETVKVQVLHTDGTANGDAREAPW